MDAFKLVSPMATDPEVTSTSFHDQFASQIGRMSGGMMAEGSEELLNGSSVLVLFQAIVNEAGLEAIVVGAMPSFDGKSTFCAMSDGSIWRIGHAISGGNVATTGSKADKDETTEHCSGIDGFGDFARQVVAQSLARSGRVQQGDSVSGHVIVDCHAAICGRCVVSGNMIVNIGETNAVRFAVGFVLDCPSDGLDDSVDSYLRLKEMTAEEVKKEIEGNKLAIGILSPFPVKMGSA